MTMSDAPDTVREMMSAEEVLAKIKVSRTTLFRLERDGFFPQGRAITPHRKLWFADEVIEWQKALQDPTSALSEAMHARAVRVRPKARLKAV